jgi:hypothetical protein
MKAGLLFDNTRQGQRRKAKGQRRKSLALSLLPF